VKRAVVGSGAASKDQVSYMIQAILNLKSAPKYYDATDALAVALCHYHKSAKQRRSKKGAVESVQIPAHVAFIRSSSS